MTFEAIRISVEMMGRRNEKKDRQNGMIEKPKQKIDKYNLMNNKKQWCLD